MDDRFKRTRKRRTSYELEKQVQELRGKLQKYEDTRESHDDVTEASDSRSPGLEVDPLSQGIAPQPVGSISASGVFNDTAALTTIPSVELPQEAPLVSTGKPRPRALGNVHLSVVEVDELFAIFFRDYHPYLPFLNPAATPVAYFESCGLLFWSIISVAARRYKARPALLAQLSRNVTDMAWRCFRIMPTSKGIVQSLILLCSWPFPTSSSALDSTYLLSGIMLQLGTQLGLHQILNPEDFTKFPVHLNEAECADRIATWAAKNPSSKYGTFNT